MKRAALLGVAVLVLISARAEGAAPPDSPAPRLSALASEYAPRTTVVCHTFDSMVAGDEVTYAEGPLIRLSRDVCRALKAAPRLVSRPGAFGPAASLVVFGHEIGHATGLAHDATPTAECYGVAHVRELALRVGFRKPDIPRLVKWAASSSTCEVAA